MSSLLHRIGLLRIAPGHHVDSAAWCVDTQPDTTLAEEEAAESETSLWQHIYVYTVWWLCGCSCMTLVSTGGGCGIFSWAQPRAVGGRSSSRDGGRGHQSSISPPLRRSEAPARVLAEGLVHHQVGTRSQTHTARGCTHSTCLAFSSWGARGCPQSLISCDP